MATVEFDPSAYKATTREQWQEAAEAWHRWGPTLEAWLGQATEMMLDLARIGDGDRVLDVAAGAGGQTLAAARRVGPRGAVLATDISPNLAGVTEPQREEAWAEIEAQLRQFEGPDGLVGPCQLLVGAATK